MLDYRNVREEFVGCPRDKGETALGATMRDKSNYRSFHWTISVGPIFEHVRTRTRESFQ